MLCRKDRRVVFITNMLQQKLTVKFKFRSSGKLILLCRTNFQKKARTGFFHTHNQLQQVAREMMEAERGREREKKKKPDKLTTILQLKLK